MTVLRSTKSLAALLTLIALATAAGCAKTPKYGAETISVLPGGKGQVWAVAPALNLSGQREVDPLLQSDILFQKLQEVRGLTVVPVDRVIQVFAAMRIDQVQSPAQAAIVCQALGADALIVPTVTAYDPYDPPKWGGGLQMFRSGKVAAAEPIDIRDLARQAAPDPDIAPPPATDIGFVQSVGMFDAANGSVREALMGYARGRHDPKGPTRSPGISAEHGSLCQASRFTH